MLEDSPYSGLPYLGCRKSRGHEVAECYPIIKWPPNPLPHPSQTATHPAPQIATQGGGHFKLPPLHYNRGLEDYSGPLLL